VCIELTRFDDPFESVAEIDRVSDASKFASPGDYTPGSTAPGADFDKVAAIKFGSLANQLP
jgi:hypothetical protein